MEGIPRGLFERWRAAGQDHVFRYWPELSPDERATLQAQLEGIDVAAVVAGFRAAQGVALARPDELEPPDVLRTPEADAAAQRHRARGNALLTEGGAGVITVAGGQGTRLGFAGPKGSFPLGPVSGRSLFGIFAQRLAGLGRRVGRPVPWWIMTSPATDGPTRAFFTENGHFGLPPESVHFIVQGSLPALDLGGRILLAEPGRVAEAPDGHGGVFAALSASGALDELTARGIRALFYHHVDNPLARVADPAYLGFHLEAGAEMSCKVVEKSDPLEKVGFLCRRAGRTAIVEYSELPPDVAAERAADGGLRFWAGSIGIHVFDVDFLRRIAEGPALPLHLARKSVPHVEDPAASAPNAYKIERFVFDALARAARVAVMETRRGDEYSPVKNARGDASPETARRDLMRTYRRWLSAAGLSPPGDGIGLELDHSRFDGPEDLRRSGIRQIADGAPYIRLAEGTE